VPPPQRFWSSNASQMPDVIPAALGTPAGAAPDALTRNDPALDDAIQGAAAALIRRQAEDGHWVFELEADATIPAEYVLLEHYLDRIDPALQARIGVYLRRIQGAHGGWPLFHDGAFDLSASVKAYFALKAIGDDPAAPHMTAARDAILAAGGAERANVFTRIQLALFGAVPWRATPAMPVEIMHLPKWFFFHLSKVSYWSRTVLVPLLVLMALRPRARNPRGIRIAELFRTPPEQVQDWFPGPHRSHWGGVFKALDSMVRKAEPLFPSRLRQKAVDQAVAFVTERLNGEDGLGAIYPAMANTVMMFDALGYAPDHPDAAIAWRSVRKLMVVSGDEAYCQPCLSPIWDTGLAGHAIAEAEGATVPEVDAACAWLLRRQVTDVRGDWADARPDAPAGGWPFQYANPHYPDVDDTAVVAMLLHRNGDPAHAESIALARDWILGMQSRNGGWGAFDADNDHDFLNHIPFADHGALLDPPTADVSARCISMMAQLGEPRGSLRMLNAVDYLEREQEADGSWFGRWGVNYIYGTWSSLCALNAAGFDATRPSLRRGADWLIGIQNPDGGWGEDCDSYKLDYKGYEPAASTASQTAWALLGLMAAGEVDHPAVARGVAWLWDHQEEDGLWGQEAYTGGGFPRVFYLRYHGYPKFFPLWALARYRNLRQGNSRQVVHGM
jgi:squalene-hopene/tetraprenyl-beta-curcumene cyclase